MARVEIWETVIDGSGRPVGGADVEIFLARTATPATIFAAESGGTTLTNPVQTVNGGIPGWLEEGEYDLEVSGTGITTTTRRFNAIVGGAPKLAAGQVTATELATDSVGTAEIQAGAVGNAELAGDSVDAPKIAVNAVGASEIAAGAVGSSELASGAAVANIGVGGITANELGTNSVGVDELANNSVDTAAIVDGAVTALKQAAEINNLHDPLLVASTLVSGALTVPTDDAAVMFPVASVTNVFTATTGPPPFLQIDNAWFDLTGRFTDIVARLSFACDISPATAISFGLHPVTGVAGGAVQVGPAVAGSTASLGTPASDSVGTPTGVSFDIPADGLYVPCLDWGSTLAASTDLLVTVQLFLRRLAT